MTTIHIAIERDIQSRSSADGARYRVKVRAQPGGPALLMSTRLCQSVTRAKAEAEAVFGGLSWRDGGGDPPELRAAALLEIDD